jgi:hypothetical protein
VQFVMHPAEVQQVVHIVILPPTEIVLVVQVSAIAVEVDNARISAIIVFMLTPCLNDKTA